jgi:hypothetical protein
LRVNYGPNIFIAYTELNMRQFQLKIRRTLSLALPFRLRDRVAG